MNITQIYSQHYSKVKKISRQFSKTTGIDYREIEGHLNGEFFLAVRDFDSNKWESLSKWLNARLKARAIDFTRSRYVKEMKDTLHINDIEPDKSSEEDAATFEIADDFNLEENVIDSLVRRQLIEKLIENKKDPLTTAIVREYLSPEQPSPTAIGLKLGVHHEIVKRRIKSLSKFFDEKQFGSLDSYLAV